MAFCSNCGKELSEDVKFCPYCGAATGAAAGSTATGAAANGAAANGATAGGAATGAAAGDGWQYASEQGGKTRKKGWPHQKDRRTEDGRPGPALAIISFILGVFSLFNHVTIVSVSCSIAAIVLGILCFSRRARLRGLAVAGILFAILNFLTYVAWYGAHEEAPSAQTHAAADVSRDLSRTQGKAPGQEQGKVQSKNLDSSSDRDADMNAGKDADKDFGADSGTTPDTNTGRRGVDPDLKAFLDSYEDFVDEYVVFMQQYSKNPTDLSLLTEYASIMQKYSDFAAKVEAYDTKTMSTEDASYYIEVTSRCTQKMLKILGN